MENLTGLINKPAQVTKINTLAVAGVLRIQIDIINATPEDVANAFQLKENGEAHLILTDPKNLEDNAG